MTMYAGQQQQVRSKSKENNQIPRFELDVGNNMILLISNLFTISRTEKV